MQAVKGNRSYLIEEAQKASYVKQGFDIKNDEGQIVAYGAGKTVPYEMYASVLKEIEELKTKLGAIPSKGIDGMTKTELKALADQLGVELASKATNEQIIELIKAKQEIAKEE